MLRPHLSVMGQALTKNLQERISSSPRVTRSWKVVSHPVAVHAVIVFFLLFYVGVPIWFYFCTWFRRHAVFLHYADWPFQSFAYPESYGFSCARHFYLETAPGTFLGVWHILPASLGDRCSEVAMHVHSSRMFLKNDHRPVVLYLHGSAESRTAAYRRSMYKVLAGEIIDAHVIAFDYRGFGDSTYALPTVERVVEDAESMYAWLKSQVPTSRIFLWGHSMGSGVAIRLGEKAAQEEDDPAAIILEAPFTSVADVTHTFPLSFFHRHMPFFKNFCSDRTRHVDTNFDNDERIGRLTAPILVLHAADDSMVWPEQGKRLWKIALQSRESSQYMPPLFVELDSQYGCGHRNIHRDPNLPFIFRQFMQEARAFTTRKGGAS